MKYEEEKMALFADQFVKNHDKIGEKVNFFLDPLDVCFPPKWSIKMRSGSKVYKDTSFKLPSSTTIPEPHYPTRFSLENTQSRKYTNTQVTRVARTSTDLVYTVRKYTNKQIHRSPDQLEPVQI